MHVAKFEATSDRAIQKTSKFMPARLPSHACAPCDAFNLYILSLIFRMAQV